MIASIIALVFATVNMIASTVFLAYVLKNFRSKK